MDGKKEDAHMGGEGERKTKVEGRNRQRLGKAPPQILNRVTPLVNNPIILPFDL